MRFEHGTDLEAADLTDNGKLIYDKLVSDENIRATR